MLDMANRTFHRYAPTVFDQIFREKIPRKHMAWAWVHCRCKAIEDSLEVTNTFTDELRKFRAENTFKKYQTFPHGGLRRASRK